MARKKNRVETRQERYKRTHPWVRLVEWARRRCNDRVSKWYPYYGARGITCTLNAADVEKVWIQCEAHKLKRPSLDRIKSDRGYEVGNIRIIEFNHNSLMAHDPSFKFLFEAQADTPPLNHGAGAARAFAGVGAGV